MTDPDPDRLLARFTELPAAKLLLERLAQVPMGVFMVGGGVRDLILGLAPVDLDLVVDGDLEALGARLGAPVTLYDRFGTGSLEIEGFRYDLARPRQEVYDHPGALPTVSAGSLEADLARRDFTVNAIALGVGGPVRGRLAAFGQALDDLGQRRLTVLHDASFTDDPTRMLRLARYQSRLGFQADPHTLELLQSARDGGALQTVSGHRLGAELRLLAREPDPIAGLRVLTDLGLAGALAPGFGLGDPAIAERALELLPPDGDRGAVALAAAALDVDGLGRWLDRLGFSAPERERIVAAAGAPELAGRLAAVDASPSALVEAVAGVPPEAVALAGALGPEARARKWLDDLRDVRLAIGGDDLLAAGIPAGPQIGQGLRAALAAKLDGCAEGPEAELQAALAAISSGPGPGAGH